MDLASYADLVIELVNTREPYQDSLRDLDTLRELLEIRPHLSGRPTRRDLDALRDLRAELRAIFVSAAAGDEGDAVDRLNALLIRHPIHPQISGHDGHAWHMHLTEGGSIPDRYAAGASMGLAVHLSTYGIERLGVCAAPSCGNVFVAATADGPRRYCSDACAGRGYGGDHRDSPNTEMGNADLGR